MGWGQLAVTTDGHRALFWDDENILELAMIVVHPCECTTDPWVIHATVVNHGSKNREKTHAGFAKSKPNINHCLLSNSQNNFVEC